MLKPRKQKKYAPISNKKVLLRLLKGKVLQFDMCMDEYYNTIEFYFIKSKNRRFKRRTHYVINNNSINWTAFQALITKLEEDQILLYAPTYCSTWVIAHDKKALIKEKR